MYRKPAFRSPYRRYVPRPVRRAVNQSGRAAYTAAKTYVPKGSAARLGSAMGAAAGRSLAGAPGSAIGSAVGQRLGKQFAQITGVGDYFLHDGTRIGSPFTSKTPTLRSSINNNSVTVSRSEYITDIYSGTGSPATGFKNQSFAINAGLPTADGGIFSWLPIVASGFQQYRFKQLIFEFRSTSGNAISSTNSSLGTIIMSANYDSTLPPYTTKTEALNSQWAVSGGTDKSILFPVECRPREVKERWYDVRGQPIKSNQNIAIYDLANFQIATQGVQEEEQNLGELWVSYTVELTKFKSNANYTYTAHWSNSLETGNDISNDYPLGNLKPIARGVNDNLLMSYRIDGVQDTKWVFPQQLPENSQFMIVAKYAGQSATGTVEFEIDEEQDIQLLSFNDNNTQGVIATATTNAACRVWYVRVTGPNPEVRIKSVNLRSMDTIRTDWFFIEAATDTCLGSYFPGQKVSVAP